MQSVTALAKNIPLSIVCDESKLNEFFAYFGGIKVVKSPIGKNQPLIAHMLLGSYHKRSAFVEFNNMEDALSAIERIHHLKPFGKDLGLEIVGQSPEKVLADSLKIDFSYKYQESNPIIIQNISHALEKVPRLYHQILHIMNKMNIPPPFEEQETFHHLLSNYLKGDDDWESSEDEKDDVKFLFKVKRDREKEAEIPNKRLKEEFEKDFAISDKDLMSNKFTLYEITSISTFKNYQRGIASSTLYIKNLDKRVTEDDLLMIFGGLFDTREERDSSLEVKLMQEGRMKGQAFVKFPNEDLAALALDKTLGYLLYEKPMVISYGKTKT